MVASPKARMRKSVAFFLFRTGFSGKLKSFGQNTWRFKINHLNDQLNFLDKDSVTRYPEISLTEWHAVRH